MKRLLTALVLSCTLGTAFAHGHGPYPGYYRGYDWQVPLAAAAITGAIVYGTRPYYYQPVPPYAPPYAYPYSPNVYVPVPTGHYVQVYDQYCNCYRNIWVQN